MITHWNKFTISNREKLHRRIYKGIPDKLRRSIWQKMLKVETQIDENKQTNDKPSTFNRMLELGKSI